MEPSTVSEVATHDFSFVSLFLQADPIVKGVMILLIIASIACWTIVFEKVVRLARVRRQAKSFETIVKTGGSLEPEREGIASHILKAGLDQWRDQDATESRAERRERIERAMRAALGLEIKRLQGGLSLLATSGATAPFIGLFGTVWGIMNSFSSIAKSQDTSLAVVAPGIAEALFATAIGLVVAIPAVMAYNKLSNDVARIKSSFLSCIAALGNRLARDRSAQTRATAAE